MRDRLCYSKKIDMVGFKSLMRNAYTKKIVAGPKNINPDDKERCQRLSSLDENER